MMKTLLISLVCLISFSKGFSQGTIFVPTRGGGGTNSGGGSGTATNLNPVALGQVTNVVLAFATNSQNLWVNNQQLSRLYTQLDGGTGSVNIAFISDSINWRDEVASTFSKYIGANGYDIPFGATFISLSSGPITNRTLAEGLVVRTNWMAAFNDMGSNAVYIATNNSGLFGGCNYANQLKARFIKDAGFGTATIMYKTNGGNWSIAGTISLNGGHSAGIFTTNLILGYYQMMVSNGSGGLVRFIGEGMTATNNTGLRITSLVGANQDSSDVFYNSTNISTVHLRDMQIHLGVYAEVSDATAYLTNGTAIAIFRTNAFNSGHIVLCTPIPSSPDLTAEGTAIRNIGIDKALPVFDAGKLWDNYFVMTNECGVTDGVHGNAQTDKVVARGFWCGLGIDDSLTLSLANNLKTGAIPFRDVDQTWSGYNIFNHYITTRSSDSGVLYGRRQGDPNNLQDSAVMYFDGPPGVSSPAALIFSMTTIGLNLWLTNNGVGGASLVPAPNGNGIINLGIAGQAFNNLNLAGNATIAGLPGSGNFVAIDAVGSLFKTNSSSSAGTNSGGFGLVNPNQFSTNGNVLVGIASANYTNLILRSSLGAASYALRIDTNTLVVTNGNVGIGTNNPQAALHVGNGGIMLVDNTIQGGTAGGSAGYKLNSPSNDGFQIARADGGVISRFRTSGDFEYYGISGSVLGVWKASGNLGIATTTPSLTLAVQGSVAVATNLFVTNTIVIGSLNDNAYGRFGINTNYFGTSITTTSANGSIILSNVIADKIFTKDINGTTYIQIKSPRTLSVQTTPIWTAGASETNLITYTNVANQLTNNFDRIEFNTDGRFVGVGSKAVNVYYGEQVIYTAGNDLYTGPWQLWGEIIRVDNSTVMASIRMNYLNNTTLLINQANTITLTLDNGTNNILKVKGLADNSVGANQVTNRTLTVTYFPAP